MRNTLWDHEWHKSSLPGGCNPVVFGNDIVLHDGAGSGLGGLSDEIGYFETMLDGGFALSCRLLESERAYYGTAISTGIMLREGVSGDDKTLYFGLASDGEYHVTARGRKGSLAAAIETARFSQTEHRFMKLARSGGFIICAVSRDGIKFETAAAVPDDFTGRLHVGFTSAFKSVYGGVILTESEA